MHCGQDPRMFSVWSSRCYTAATICRTQIIQVFCSRPLTSSHYPPSIPLTTSHYPPSPPHHFFRCRPIGLPFECFSFEHKLTTQPRSMWLWNLNLPWHRRYQDKLRIALIPLVESLLELVWWERWNLQASNHEQRGLTEVNKIFVSGEC